MFERQPKESEFLSWGYVIVWSGAILATVPFVRGWVDFVRERWGGETFTYGVIAVVVLVTAATLARLLMRRRSSLAGYAWLLGIAGLVVYLSFEFQGGSPVEAVHFLQYGILSLLLYRAFCHRVRDTSIYAAAIIAGTIVGMLDETIQWIAPGRQFDLRDIWLNFFAVALVQTALAATIRLGIISGWPNGASLRRLCLLGAVAVAYLGLCLLNTPDRIAWYSSRVPLLDFIDYRRSIMVEYGYLHGDPATALFRSRLTANELRRLARERAAEGARILDNYRDRERYAEFLEIYTPVTDPFLHEARVHLFRRDLHLKRTGDDDVAGNPRELQFNFAVAYWENRILEAYFGELLRASSYVWPAGREAEIREHFETEGTYDSRVSYYLITALSQRQVFWIFLSAVLGLLLLGRYFGKRGT